jgi:hypothetical protein
VRRFLLAAVFLAALSALLCAQVSEHQRTAVSANYDLRCTLGFSSVLYSITTDLGPSLESDNGIEVELIIQEKFGISAVIPFVVIARLQKCENDSLLFALGDPSSSLYATGRIGDWQLSAKFGYTYPLGIWNSYQAAESKLASGSGYHRIAATVSALRYMDPLAAGFSINFEHCFGKPYRLGIGAIPLSMRLGLFATEALNSSAALSAGLHQQFSTAAEINGIPEQSTGMYSLSVSTSLLINRGQRSVSFGLSKSLSDLSSPAAFTMEAALTIKRRDQQ